MGYIWSIGSFGSIGSISMICPVVVWVQTTDYDLELGAKHQAVLKDESVEEEEEEEDLIDGFRLSHGSGQLGSDPELLYSKLHSAVRNGQLLRWLTVQTRAEMKTFIQEEQRDKRGTKS